MTELDGPQLIYAKSIAGADSFLVQGEIISNLMHVHLDLPSLTGTATRIVSKVHPFAVILSQGCDLEQDYRSRTREIAQDKTVPAVLFCEVILASDLKGTIQSSEIWRRITQNNDERFHFLQTIEPEFDLEAKGIAELGVDFKRFFTVPTDEVYHRIRSGEARRRCFLQSPYLEHFCRRFANFLSRVALPVPHTSV